jgi:small subunit ribosomal protein S13
MKVEFFTKVRYQMKRVDKVLDSIYGLGRMRVLNICKVLGLPKDKKFGEVTLEERKEIVKYLNDNFVLDVALRQKVYLVKQELVRIRSFKGIRMTLGLPVNGQRSKTNARTAKRRNKKW